MRKLTAILLCIVLAFSFTACSKSNVKGNDATSENANEFLTEFFSSYDDMNKYLKDKNIAISAFALDGAGLSSILRAVYQAQSVTYAFDDPVEVASNVFSASIIVSAPDIEPLYDMYSIDRQLAEGEPDDDFVAQCFYENIMNGTTTIVTTEVAVTVRYSNGKWRVDPSNDLAFAIFPNIANAN